MEVVHLNESDFRKAMLKLRGQGGVGQRAYAEAARIITSLRYGVDELNKLTNHGESRIKSCRKYDLPGAHRLVTVQTDGFIYLLFVGDHQEVDRWLDHHRGLVITANKDTRRLSVTYVTEEVERRPVPQQDFAKATDENVPYLKRLKGFDISEFVPQGFYARQLLSINEDTGDDEIQEFMEALIAWDAQIGNLMFDVVCLLRTGNTEGAHARIEQFRGKALPVQNDAVLEEQALASTVNSDAAVVLSRVSEETVKRLFEPDRFQDWMIWLHPEQERIAKADYDKATVLTGVSGSGKTCVIVHRARHLASKYPGQRIGVLTLNRSLSRLIQNLVNDLCSEDERQNIVVMAFYDYFKFLVEHFGPQQYLAHLADLAKSHRHAVHIRRAIEQVDAARFAREFDPLSGETLQDTWDLFIDQPQTRAGLGLFSAHLHAHQKSIDAKRYLQEEFSLVRSAVSVVSRKNDYLEMDRAGRAVRFPKRIRSLVLDLLLLFEETMLTGGILDELSLTQALLPSRSKLRDLPDSMRFRCLLVDEYQDFSTLDLSLLRLIPTSSENGLFLAGDPVQRVLVKSLKMSAVGLDIISSTRERITKNYRNSKQILQAAALLANQYVEKANSQGEDVELLDPELAVRETCSPVALQVKVGHELEAAWRLAVECLGAKSAVPWSVNIATACPAVISVDDIIKAQPENCPCKVDRITGDYTRARDTLTVGTVSDVKGFEFSMIILVGCGKNSLPTPGHCADEAWREALRLYVAMTRGRDQVYLVYSGEPSEFLEAMRPALKWEAK